MALIKVKPTSAGRRAVVKVVTPGLHKGKPVAALVEKQNRGSGRNNNGHITTRHKGGGHKQHYRIVDFKRNKDGIPAKIERIEYDPTVPPTWPCCATPMASGATSLRRATSRSARR
jgi:large subunit ribosomal protein L2